MNMSWADIRQEAELDDFCPRWFFTDEESKELKSLFDEGNYKDFCEKILSLLKKRTWWRR